MRLTYPKLTQEQTDYLSLLARQFKESCQKDFDSKIFQWQEGMSFDLYTIIPQGGHFNHSHYYSLVFPENLDSWIDVIYPNKEQVLLSKGKFIVEKRVINSEDQISSVLKEKISILYPCQNIDGDKIDKNAFISFDVSDWVFKGIYHLEIYGYAPIAEIREVLLNSIK